MRRTSRCSQCPPETVQKPRSAAPSHPQRLFVGSSATAAARSHRHRTKILCLCPPKTGADILRLSAPRPATHLLKTFARTTLRDHLAHCRRTASKFAPHRYYSGFSAVYRLRYHRNLRSTPFFWQSQDLATKILTAPPTTRRRRQKVAHRQRSNPTSPTRLPHQPQRLSRTDRNHFSQPPSSQTQLSHPLHIQQRRRVHVSQCTHSHPTQLGCHWRPSWGRVGLSTLRNMDGGAAGCERSAHCVRRAGGGAGDLVR